MGVRRGSPHRAHHPGAHPPHGRHPGRGRRAARRRRDRAVRARPRPDRVRHPAFRDMGFRPAQAQPACVAGAVAGDLADPGGRGRAVGLLLVGEPPSRTWPRRAAGPGAAAEPHAARRADGVLLPVLPASGPVLRGAVVLVGGARAVRDRDRRPAAATVPHAAARRRRRSPALPARLTTPRGPDRVPLPVRRHRGHAGRPRRRRRAGDRHLADAPRRSRCRRARLTTGGRDRVLGA